LRHLLGALRALRFRWEAGVNVDQQCRWELTGYVAIWLDGRDWLTNGYTT